MLKRLILTAALAVAAVGVGAAPAAPAQASSCTYERITVSKVSARCTGSFSRFRVNANCIWGAPVSGPWRQSGQTSTVSCAGIATNAHATII